MPLDLERADRCTRAAAEKLRKSLPPSYPATPLEQYAAAVTVRNGSARRDAIVQRVADGAARLLELTVQREREALEARELAIEALRACGPLAPSWAQIGDILGLTSQAVWKRYASQAEAPRAELTIDDELARAQGSAIRPHR